MLTKLLDFEEKYKGTSNFFVTSVPGWGDVPFKLPSVRRISYYFVIINISSPSVRVVLYDRLFRECVLDEEIAYHNGEMPAGITESIAKLILYLAGASENTLEYTEELFNSYRESSNGILPMMKRTICSVFSCYSFEDLNNLEYPSLVELFINAEKALLDAKVIEAEFAFTTKEKGSNTERGKRQLRGEKQPAKKSSGFDIEKEMMIFNREFASNNAFKEGMTKEERIAMQRQEYIKRNRRVRQPKRAEKKKEK